MISWRVSTSFSANFTQAFLSSAVAPFRTTVVTQNSDFTSGSTIVRFSFGTIVSTFTERIGEGVSGSTNSTSSTSSESIFTTTTNIGTSTISNTAKQTFGSYYSTINVATSKETSTIINSTYTYQTTTTQEVPSFSYQILTTGTNSLQTKLSTIPLTTKSTFPKNITKQQTRATTTRLTDETIKDVMFATVVMAETTGNNPEVIWSVENPSLYDGAINAATNNATTATIITVLPPEPEALVLATSSTSLSTSNYSFQSSEFRSTILTTTTGGSVQRAFGIENMIPQKILNTTIPISTSRTTVGFDNIFDRIDIDVSPNYTTAITQWNLPKATAVSISDIPNNYSTIFRKMFSRQITSSTSTSVSSYFTSSDAIVINERTDSIQTKSFLLTTYRANTPVHAIFFKNNASGNGNGNVIDANLQYFYTVTDSRNLPLIAKDKRQAKSVVMPQTTTAAVYSIDPVGTLTDNEFGSYIDLTGSTFTTAKISANVTGFTASINFGSGSTFEESSPIQIVGNTWITKENVYSQGFSGGLIGGTCNDDETLMDIVEFGIYKKPDGETISTTGMYQTYKEKQVSFLEPITFLGPLYRPSTSNSVLWWTAPYCSTKIPLETEN